CRVTLSLALAAIAMSPHYGHPVTYYGRQTVGDDARDGTSPTTAWQHITKLGSAMHAGDVAYIGPGFYRDNIIVMNDGTRDKRITFIADSTGEHTGDPPGIVMIVGSDPVDGSIFAPRGAPGVYETPFPSIVLGVVEMDGNQSRYRRVNTPKEYHTDKMDPIDRATNILAYGNTLFRNENCGIYFAKESLKGSVVHNIMYDNLLGGARWSSRSTDGLATDNIVFDNLDRGILIEDTERIALLANELV